jgi:GT2 family glycosyltransferase
MKIASVTVYCNEDFRLDSWLSYSEEYKEEVYKHIIVNNGDENDTPLLESKFPDSIVLYSDSKALTASYNLGIRLALQDENVDSIMLIGNDIKLPLVNVSLLHNFLFSNTVYGMVAPIILKKDSDVIECCCLKIEKEPLKFKIFNDLKDVNIDENGIIKTDTVSGGLNLAKREFYESLGLQDEKLIMYADEIDMGLRAEKEGYEFAYNANIKGWHQHINRNNMAFKSPSADYLISRNNIYLAKKHLSNISVYRTFLNQLNFSVIIILICMVRLNNKKDFQNRLAFFKGNIDGLFNNMNFKF